MSELQLTVLNSSEGAQILRAHRDSVYQIDCLSVGYDLRLHLNIYVPVEPESDGTVTVTFTNKLGDTMIVHGKASEVLEVLHRARYRVSVRKGEHIELDVYCRVCGRRQPDETAAFCFYCEGEV